MAFQKCIIWHFLDKLFFANIFTIKLDFAIKNSIFANLQFFFADSKSRAQELSNDVSFVIFGHKTWDLEGEVKLTPPQHILVFKYPSRDRFKVYCIVASLFIWVFSFPATSQTVLKMELLYARKGIEPLPQTQIF